LTCFCGPSIHEKKKKWYQGFFCAARACRSRWKGRLSTPIKVSCWISSSHHLSVRGPVRGDPMLGGHPRPVANRNLPSTAASPPPRHPPRQSPKHSPTQTQNPDWHPQLPPQQLDGPGVEPSERRLAPLSAAPSVGRGGIPSTSWRSHSSMKDEA